MAEKVRRQKYGGRKRLGAGVFAHVAFQVRIGIAPLPGSEAEEGDIRQVGLGGISHRSLSGGDLRWNEVCLDGVRVDAVVQLGKVCD